MTVLLFALASSLPLRKASMASKHLHSQSTSFAIAVPGVSSLFDLTLSLLPRKKLPTAHLPLHLCQNVGDSVCASGSSEWMAFVGSHLDHLYFHRGMVLICEETKAKWAGPTWSILNSVSPISLSNWSERRKGVSEATYIRDIDMLDLSMIIESEEIHKFCQFHLLQFTKYYSFHLVDVAIAITGSLILINNIHSQVPNYTSLTYACIPRLHIHRLQNGQGIAGVCRFQRLYWRNKELIPMQSLELGRI